MGARTRPATSQLTTVASSSAPTATITKSHTASKNGAASSSSNTTITSWPVESSPATLTGMTARSEEHTSELQSRGHLVCRHLLEKKKRIEAIKDELKP